eukprot:863039-Amphidinium_carterae.1
MQTSLPQRSKDVTTVEAHALKLRLSAILTSADGQLWKPPNLSDPLEIRLAKASNGPITHELSQSAARKRCFSCERTPSSYCLLNPDIEIAKADRILELRVFSAKMSSTAHQTSMNTPTSQSACHSQTTQLQRSTIEQGV